MLAPKKRDNLLARRQLYLNYGALSLATKLSIAGYDTILVHGEHQPPANILEASPFSPLANCPHDIR